MFFFFHASPTTRFVSFSLHDALPFWCLAVVAGLGRVGFARVVGEHCNGGFGGLGGGGFVGLVAVGFVGEGWTVSDVGCCRWWIGRAHV